ncbi:MAG: hypothetical protein AB9M53_08365 [Leptothrix sp. (in: b-proteobacteria)]
MNVPRLIDLPSAIAHSGLTEEALFDWGISESLRFVVVVPELGACLVPTQALSHFMAGADLIDADRLPEFYSGRESGPLNIRRERLRIVAGDWEKAGLLFNAGAVHSPDIGQRAGPLIRVPPPTSTSVESGSSTMPVEAPAPANKPLSPNYSMLATREKLIVAFGAFTGMDAAWFTNLTDTPKLLAARKVAGQGGRGRTTEPWFCPLEVMQWLIDPRRRRKGGRLLSESKGWELLETHFPRVYAANSVGDPRED